MKFSKIFLTGAEGFIGSHLCEELLKKGYIVRATVQYNSLTNIGWLEEVKKKYKKNLNIVLCDINDDSHLLSITKGFDTIINLSALISIPFSYVSPKMYIRTNVEGTLNLLNVALKNKIRNFIHASTSEVYGSYKYLPMDEKHPIEANSPYAASKIAADQLVLSFNKSYNLGTKIIRPFNTFGPRQSTRAIIPTIITTLLKNKKLKLGSLYPTRDFTYIDDTVSGIIKCMQNDKAYGQVFNLGTGYDISISDLIKTIANILGKEKIIVGISQSKIRPKKSEVDKLRSNNLKAKKILNWVPMYKGPKGIEKGLKKTIEWYQKKENLINFNNSDLAI